MILTDTHTHLYLKEFEEDRKQVIENALRAGVKYMLLPNIDSSSIHGMMDLCKHYAGHCFPMMGLHPTSVKQNFRDELRIIEEWHTKEKFYAIGETGIDLYWDKTFLEEQEEAFRYQIELAQRLQLPIVIHSRNSYNEIFEVMNDLHTSDLKGVFHCFGSNIQHAGKITDWNFKLGIGGIITFKNSGLDKVIREIDLKHIILETDAPYLAPVPYRGKRNESAYIKLIAGKIASIKGISVEEVAEITTQNAMELFKFR